LNYFLAVTVNGTSMNSRMQRIVGDNLWSAANSVPRAATIELAGTNAIVSWSSELHCAGFAIIFKARVYLGCSDFFQLLTSTMGLHRLALRGQCSATLAGDLDVTRFHKIVFNHRSTFSAFISSPNSEDADF